MVEYGQYLRYEVERFIKNDLLHWDKDFNFTKVIDGVKSNQKIAEADLEKIKRVYLFCNWTTSHIDVGDDHGLSQLKDEIEDFYKYCKILTLVSFFSFLVRPPKKNWAKPK